MATNKITNIKQGVKNPNRANIYIDGKYSFSLDITQVVDFKLKIGQKITAADLEKYQQASDFGKLYQRTLEWVLMRPRSVRETRDYLIKKRKSALNGPSATNVFLEEIINRLLAKGYLDDQIFAKYYVENRLIKKGISKKRLKLELIKKGIAQGIIDQVLDSRDDEVEIQKIIAKKRAKYDDNKLIQYLVRQGFDYQLAKSLVQNYEMDSQN